MACSTPPKPQAWTKILYQVVHFPDVLRNPTLPAHHGFSSEKFNENARITMKLLELIGHLWIQLDYS